MASGGRDANKLSDETFDLLCTVCKHEGRNTEAVKYCTDCSDYYCSKCVKVHDTVPVLKTHKIVDKGQSQAASSKPLPMVPTERCDRHGLKPVDMFCENHDGVGCSTCMTVEHRLCQGLYYIPEYIQNNESACNPTDTKIKLDSVENTLAENLRHFENEKQQAMTRKAESIQNIRTFRKEINKRLDDLEQTSVDEIEKKYQELISKVEEEIEIIKETKNVVTSAKDKLAPAGNNVSQTFVSTKMGQTVAMDAEKCLKERIHESESQAEDIIRFIPDQKLSEILNKMKVLGCTLQHCSSRSNERDTVDVKQKSDLLQTRGMKKYPVNVQSDLSDCNIFSSCVLKDGTIILADNNNMKLKRLDRSTYRVRDHYNLPQQPWQVCAINYQDVAVSYQKQVIRIISLGYKMTQKSLIKTDFLCYGLAHANYNLYITDRKPSVYIYSVSGSKLIQYSKDQSGQSLFSGEWLSSISVSGDGSKIYVAYLNKELLVLDNKGKMVGKYNGPELKNATDVHFTGSGDVLVCGWASNNVLQFGADGELKREVVQPDGGKGGCQTVCCNQEMSKMIVGRKRNEIEIYDLI